MTVMNIVFYTLNNYEYTIIKRYHNQENTAPKTWDVLVFKPLIMDFLCFGEAILISHTILSGSRGIRFSASERSQSLFNVD